MATVRIRETFRVDGTLTNMTSVTFDGDPATNPSTGVYEYVYTGLTPGSTLSYTVVWVYDGETYTENRTAEVPVSSSSPGVSSADASSFLSRTIGDVRRYTDEPSYEAKYLDNDLVKMIEQSYTVLIGEINRIRTSPAVGRLVITFVAGQYVYPLPPTIGNVWSMYTKDPSCGTKLFYVSRGVWNSDGRGLWIEGNNLMVQEGTVVEGVEVTIEFQPNGTARLNTGTIDTSGVLVNADGDEVTLPSTPDFGELDTQKHGYVGSVFRVLGHTVSGYGYVQERIIVGHDNTTRVVTLDTPLDPNPTGQAGTLTYEIAPAINRGLDHAVALYLAKTITALEGDIVRNQMITKEYNMAIRAIRLEGYNSVLDQASPPQDGYGLRRRLYGGNTSNPAH